LGIQLAQAAQWSRGHFGLVARMAGCWKETYRPESGGDGYVAQPMGFDAEDGLDLAY